jgi:hypothetical protein
MTHARVARQSKRISSAKKSALAAQPPAIVSGLAVGGTVGKKFGYQIKATNHPTSFEAAGLPAGLIVDSTRGAVTGAPAAAGTFTVTVSAANSAGIGKATLTITVKAAPQRPAITSAKAVGGTVGKALSYRIKATGRPTSFAASGLPSGLAIDSSTGVISGSPKGPGTFTVDLSATNSVGTGVATLTMTVKAGPVPLIKSSTTAAGKVGKHLSYTIKATNNPTSFGANGLPPGLSVNGANGLISGAPIMAGTSIVEISATNSAGTGTAELAITITTPASGEAPLASGVAPKFAGVQSAWVPPPVPPVPPMPQGPPTGSLQSTVSDVGRQLSELGRHFSGEIHGSRKYGIVAASAIVIQGLLTLLAMTDSDNSSAN